MLKVYTMDDYLFCWGCVVIAKSAEEAAEIWNKKQGYTNGVSAEDFEEHELEGFVFEAGGNG